ncbi:hypothetical protein GW820_06485 [archaeon]|nr:hypothetical protein [archaeon]
MLNTSKPNKKSTHGKKNWRKNIDVSDLEKINNQKAKEVLNTKKVALLKNDALFSLDKCKLCNNNFY